MCPGNSPFWSSPAQGAPSSRLGTQKCVLIHLVTFLHPDRGFCGHVYICTKYTHRYFTQGTLTSHCCVPGMCILNTPPPGSCAHAELLSLSPDTSQACARVYRQKDTLHLWSYTHRPPRCACYKHTLSLHQKHLGVWIVPWTEAQLHIGV